MKKTVIALAILGAVTLSLGIAGYAYAQSQAPTYGYHGMMMGYGYGMMYGEEGPMHETMVAVFAEALGLTPEEIEARHDAGETLWQIAESQGLSPEDIQDLMLTAHDQALEQAVAEGWMTPEQAGWMQSHMGQGFYGSGACDGSGPAFQGQGRGYGGMMGAWGGNAGPRP